MRKMKSAVTFPVRRGAVRRSAQGGSMMVEVSLALILSALAAVGTMQALIRADLMSSADTEADSLLLYRKALQDYTDEFYSELQNNLPITKNSVTLAAGTAPGQTMQPTVANLAAMGYALDGFSNVPLLVDGAAYRNVIRRIPVGCTGLACNIVGEAYVDRPYRIRGTTDPDNNIVGQMLSRMGGLGGASIEGSEADITGAGAAWSAANPVAGAPAGVVAARFGIGSSAMSAYVRMNDVRDPNLQGAFTVAGNTTLNGATTTIAGSTTVNNSLTVTGQTTLQATTATTIDATGTIRSTADIVSDANVGASDVAACLRAALSASGEIVSRAVNCVSRVVVDNTGVQVNSSTGTARARLDGNTGLVSVNSAAGAQVIGLDGGSGRMTAQLVNAAMSATSGAACTTNGDIATDASAAGTLLVCRAGTWRRPGLDEQALGGACSVDGQLAQTSSMEGLICRGGFWRLINDRLTAVVSMDLWSGNGSGVVPAPACGVGGTADVAVAALQGGADYGGVPPRNRFEFRVTGTGPWTVDPVLVDQSGSAYSSSFAGAAYALGWTATTYCKYVS